MDKEKTGILIKEARLEKGLTQSELGDLIGVTNKAVSRWERGESFPDVAILDSLAGVLSLQIEDIVLGERQSTKEEHIQIVIGEKDNSSLEQILKFLVQEWKDQSIEMDRRTTYARLFSCIVITLIILYFGGLSIGLPGLQDILYFNFYDVPYAWLSPLYLCLFGLILLNCMLITMKVKQETLELRMGNTRLEHWIYLGSIATGIYLILLMTGSILSSINHGPVYIYFLSHAPQLAGSLIHDQILALYLLHLLLMIYNFVQLIRGKSGNYRKICISITILFICLIYGNNQRMLSEDPRQLLLVTTGCTLVLIAGSVISLMIAGRST